MELQNGWKLVTKEPINSLMSEILQEEYYYNSIIVLISI